MLYRLLLAVPFLIGIAVLQGLTVEIDTFHGSDARVYQLPTILQLSERLDLSEAARAEHARNAEEGGLWTTRCIPHGSWSGLPQRGPSK